MRSSKHAIRITRAILFSGIFLVTIFAFTRSWHLMLSWQGPAAFFILFLLALAALWYIDVYKEAPKTTTKVSKDDFVQKRSEFFKQKKAQYMMAAVAVLTIAGLYATISGIHQVGVILILVAALVLNILRRQFRSTLIA